MTLKPKNLLGVLYMVLQMVSFLSFWLKKSYPNLPSHEMVRNTCGTRCPWVDHSPTVLSKG